MPEETLAAGEGLSPSQVEQQAPASGGVSEATKEQVGIYQEYADQARRDNNYFTGEKLLADVPLSLAKQRPQF